MNDAIVKVDNLSITFKGSSKPALKNISTQIYKGQMTGIVGPDGAGKTTLIRHMVGLLLPSSGNITIAGFDTQKQANEIHEIAGYMPQKFGLYEDLTVIENLNLYAELRSLPSHKSAEKFKQLLHFTGLEKFQERLAGNLSGGMKQKLGLACSLIGDPKVLFLDEPSVGVDPISRRELLNTVKTLLTQDIAVVWSTSYLDEAEKCDRVILLNEGEKLYDGTPQDILKNVEGRTWHIRGLSDQERRKTLNELFDADMVIDGFIQGRNIRVLTKHKSHEKAFPKLKWAKAVPCFEDAFIDILGGLSYRHSALAKEIDAKPMDTKPIIDAQHLHKKFGSFTAVRDNTFQIYRGEIFGLLGPNGAGKSTTFKMLCGLLMPDGGRALVKGLDLKTAPSLARARIGYMAQKFSLYGNLNVEQNLEFFSGLYGLSGKTQRHQIQLMTDIFDFKDHLKTNAAILPLGFKQRLALACAVMHQPDVLFLDEPTSGVDPLTRREFWMHINAMVEKGITIMVTTHFMDEAEYCDRVALIYQSENIATGTPDELKQMVTSKELPDPTLEDTFITLIEQTNAKQSNGVNP